jgi:cobalt transporter subunit CbtA
MLKRIIVAAALAGLVSGLLLTGMQRLQVTPLIRQAEVLEAGTHATAPSLLATMSANVVLATGFALLLGAAFSLRRRTGWRVGLLWGAAGYAVFFLAPALGLPPELPGTEFAPLRERELWWAGTVACSAAGLWLAVFSKRPLPRLLGVVLLIAPHLLGAPRPEAHGGTATVDMTSDFIRAAYIANAMLWLSIGGWFGFFYRDHSAREEAADS